MNDGAAPAPAITGGVPSARGPAAPARRDRRRLVSLIRLAAVVALVAIAFTTPGFTAMPAVLALLTTMSFIGCIAVAMSFVTISGNIMSLCFGATAAASSLIFIGVLQEEIGLLPAIAASLAFGAAATGLQGFCIGYFRANPIIMSIAALALILGVAQLVTRGSSLYAETGGPHEVLKGRIAGVPIEFIIFVATALIGHLLLGFTRFGRNLYMIGNSERAAEAAGVRVWRSITGAYVVAGIFAAVPGIMLGSRYGLANMEYGIGYDYDAIAAVLVGGTAIHGGEGNVLRTFLGIVVIAVVQVIVLLYGFRQEWQYLITGLIVLGVIMLHTVGSDR